MDNKEIDFETFKRVFLEDSDELTEAEALVEYEKFLESEDYEVCVKLLKTILGSKTK